jgi:hypothetical protein
MLTRRAALQGGTATVAVIAVTGAVAARVAVDDPVIALVEEIKRHAAAWSAIDGRLEESRYEAFADRYCELWVQLRETHARTLPGAVAKLRYFSDEHDGDLGIDLAQSLLSDLERLAREG